MRLDGNTFECLQQLHHQPSHLRAGHCSSSDHLSEIALWVKPANNSNTDSLGQRLRSQRAVGVKVWRLADADSTMAKSLTQSFVIKRCGMEGAAVVPNC
jgi:hypothetical protein